jgi:hypothetical protein
VFAGAGGAYAALWARHQASGVEGERSHENLHFLLSRLDCIGVNEILGGGMRIYYAR